MTPITQSANGETGAVLEASQFIQDLANRQPEEAIRFTGSLLSHVFDLPTHGQKRLSIKLVDGTARITLDVLVTCVTGDTTCLVYNAVPYGSKSVAREDHAFSKIAYSTSYKDLVIRLLVYPFQDKDKQVAALIYPSALTPRRDN